MRGFACVPVCLRACLPTYPGVWLPTSVPVAVCCFPYCCCCIATLQWGARNRVRGFAGCILSLRLRCLRLRNSRLRRGAFWGCLRMHVCMHAAYVRVLAWPHLSPNTARFLASYSTTSDNAFAFYKKAPENWRVYHHGYRSQVKSWPKNPLYVIADVLRAHPGWVVGDFGCGDAELSTLLPQNKVHSFDLVAANDNVVACDMKRVPLKASTLDAAVYCLSLMGTNVKVCAGGTQLLLCWVRAPGCLPCSTLICPIECAPVLRVHAGLFARSTQNPARGRHASHC